MEAIKPLSSRDSAKAPPVPTFPASAAPTRGAPTAHTPPGRQPHNPPLPKPPHSGTGYPKGQAPQRQHHNTRVRRQLFFLIGNNQPPHRGTGPQSTQRQRDRAGASIGSDQTPFLAQQRESLILPRASLRAQDRSRGAPVEAQTPSASPGTLPPENRCPHVPCERSTDPRSPHRPHASRAPAPQPTPPQATPFRDRLPQGTGDTSEGRPNAEQRNCRFANNLHSAPPPN